MELYRINAELSLAIESAIDPETGEIKDEEMLQVVDQLQMERDEKIENICLYIKNLKSDARQLKEAEESFRNRRREAEYRAEKLTEYLAKNLSGEKFKAADGLASVSWRKSQSVSITNAALLSDRFLTIPDPVPNKIEIKKAIQAGEQVDGAELVTNNNIQIR